MVPVLILPLLFAIVTGAPSNICPESCKCTPAGHRELRAECMSTEFLEKLTPKQINQIVELDLSELSLKTVPAKLGKLKNLKKLDLTGNLIDDLRDFPHFPKLTHLSLRANKLEKFSAEHLPTALRQLDLSSNRIGEFEDLPKLDHLEKIDLNENYVNCDCDFLKVRDALLKRNANFIYPTKCFSPKNVNDVPLLHVYCVNDVVLSDDFSQNDEPEDELEDGYVQAKNELVPAGEEDDGSGSGDGLIEIVSSSVPHCQFDCSTPKPINPDPSLPRADIPGVVLGVLGQTPTTEAPFLKEVGRRLENAPSEEVSKDPTPAKPVDSEAKKADTRAAPPRDGEVQPEPKKNTTTYVVVGCLLVVMCALVVYAVVKRKRKNGGNRRPVEEASDKHPAVEMKPLVTKPNEVTAAVAEKVPLMNGQNGHAENGDANQRQNEDATEVIELRPSPEEPVTPDATKRVTIKAKEYPSPKSPVMIQRRLDDDGRVVVTPSSLEDRD